MAAATTTTRRPSRSRAAPRKDPASLEDAALEIAREPILRIGRILDDVGPDVPITPHREAAHA